MDELVEWLRARLDEEERIARAATLGPWVQSGIGDYGWTVDFGRPGAGVETADSDQGLADADFIAAHNPARVLRDVEARRQLLADLLSDQHHRNEEDHWYSCAALIDADGEPLCFDDSRAPGACDCGRDARVARRVRLLALPYADHPDYRDEWRS